MEESFQILYAFFQGAMFNKKLLFQFKPVRSPGRIKVRAVVFNYLSLVKQNDCFLPVAGGKQLIIIFQTYIRIFDFILHIFMGFIFKTH